MKALLPLALSVLALPTRREGVPLVFDPPARTSWSLELESELDVSGGELTVEMDGADVPAEYLPELVYAMRDRHSLSLSEAVVATEDGRALVRRYDALAWENEGSMRMTMAGSEEEAWPWEGSFETPLEGRTVRFALEGEPRPVLDDDASSELPFAAEELARDLGWNALLPQEAVAEGDEWEADGEELALLWEPGGTLGWVVPEEAAQYLDPSFDERRFAGSLTLRLVELDEAAGRARATVAGELTRTTVRPGDLSRVPVVDGTATDTVEEVWEVEGTLEWDLGARRLASLALEGPWSSATTTERDPGQAGPTYRSTFSYEGTYALRARSGPGGERVLEAASPR